MRPSLRGVCQLDCGKQGLQRALPEAAEEARGARRAIAVIVDQVLAKPARSCILLSPLPVSIMHERAPSAALGA